ncbi:MAG: serine--tRNA ligase [Reyranellaceae bacterium]
MHDIKLIRDNPEAFDAALKRRNLAPLSARLLELDRARRTAISDSEQVQARRKQLSKQIGIAKGKGENADALLAEAAGLDGALKADEAAVAQADAAIRDALAAIPNLPAEDVPPGADESANVELRKVGTPRQFNFSPKDHVEIGEGLGMMDFATAAKISGARFVMLKGKLARLERALAQFMLDLHTEEHGYTEIDPPLLVKDNALYGTGQLPKFAEDQFLTTGDELTRRWLIPTAEVPLTNIVADEIVEAASLPRRYTAWTPCFRSEAGAAGRDTRGMIRQHQFPKVEMVSIVAPEESEAEHRRMTKAAEKVLKRLGLPYRTIVLCTGDMGFSARKTYDIEVWLPGQHAYREISSCSNCGDFQARRMNARFRRPGEKGTQFLHTLNGSGVAVGRCLVAILENYQEQDGSVVVPAALRPYMGGLERIERPAS